jgi:chromate transporter
LALSAFAALALFDIAFPWVVGAAALTGWWASRWAPQQLAAGGGHAAKASATRLPAFIDDNTPTPPHARFSRARLVRVLGVGIGLWLLGMAVLVAWLGWPAAYTQMAWFFTKAALLTFGGAYAVLPYVHQGAVETHQWLTAAQMMDGLALGESTPGPLIMVVAFVGFLGGWQQALLGPDALLAAGVLAACIVTWFTFLPSFIFILAGGPLVEATHGRLGFTAPLTAISAAVVGVILSLALHFGQHVLLPVGGFDALAGLMMAAAAVALIRFQIGVLPVLACSGLVGLLLRLV